jgi:GMP synthase-like glutamine amidotransferase
MLQLDEDDPAGRLGDWLREAGVELDERLVTDAGMLPGGISGHDALVVLGGAMAAGQDAEFPWLPAVRGLLRAAVAAEVPVLGVCLGAQLLALAHGGRVEPSPGGPEIGGLLIAKRAAAATDPLFGALPITPDVIQWHVDAITRLPAGAVHLAASPACENQAFRLGRLAWGIQFHIETEPATVRRWAAGSGALLADKEPADVERLLAHADAVHDDIAEVWQPFANAFAEIVRDPGAVAPPPTMRAATAEPITDPVAIRAALAAEATAAHQQARLPMPGLRHPRDD